MKPLALLAIASLLAAAADEPKTASSRGASDRMEILATVHANREAVKQVIGDDLNGYIVVMEVTIKPRMEEGVKIDRDDFILLTSNDGQRTKPFAPSQIVGTAGLVLKTTLGPTSGVMGQNNGPVWSGPVGSSRPRQLPGSGGGIGTAPTQVATNQTEAVDTKPEKDSPLKKLLIEKELIAGEIKTPTKGLLYFPIDGKHKTKNFMLMYRGLGGRIDVEFK